MKMVFKGFDKIENLEYKQRVFRCKGCANECDVSEIKTEDGLLCYGDKCEKYSARGKERDTGLESLFEEREKILMSFIRNKDNRKSIGIPRVGLFNDLLPFWAIFFNNIGYNVETSKKTDKEIVKEGLKKSTAPFCFPYKVCFGHFASLDGKVDFIFVPDVIESFRSKFENFGLIKDTEWDKSYTCPYLQNLGAVVARNTVFNTKIINPHVSLRGDRKALVKELYRAFSENGEKIKKRKIRKAFEKAEQEYFNFKEILRERGEKVLSELKDREKGIVIVGRPYSLYDEAVNLRLVKKISNRGFLPIPIDYLPLPEEDLSRKWENEFGITGQILNGTAEVIKKEGLNVIFLDYFGCGPNSFLKTFFSEELGKPHLTLQIDEHTADAGLETRLEAFLDTIKPQQIKKRSEFKVKEYSLEEIKGKKLWIPHMCDAAFILASVFRTLGYDSEVLPRSNDSLLNLGRKYTDGEQCVPSIITTEDILKRVFSQDFQQDKEAFFQGKSQGPCRYGRYYMNQQLILYKLGLNVPIFTLDNRDSYRGLGVEAKISAYDGIISQGLLEKALHFTKPFEINKGESERVYKKYLNEISKIVEKGIGGRIYILSGDNTTELTKKLKEAREEFSNIKKKDEQKPVIFVTGEIFVRSSSVANQNLIEKIENLGGVALLEPIISFFDYVHEEKLREYKEKLRYNFFGNLKNFAKTRLDIHFTKRDAHDIENVFNGFFNLHEPSAKEVMDRGAKYVHPSYSGEAIVTLGGSDYFASHNYVDGIINTMPFNCMPGMIVTSKTAEFRKNNNNIPFLNLDYDGSFDASRDEKLEIFMYQVKEKISKK